MIRLESLVLAALLLPASALAQEIRILDPLGLVRVIKPVKGTAEVVVDVEQTPGDDASAPVTASLTNVDGLAPEKTANLEPPGRYRFLDVESGTWRLDLGGVGLVVSEVNVM